MAGFRDLLAQAKSQITEIDTNEAASRIAAGGVIVLDVREPDEYEQGALPDALHIPRGHLEAQIEGRIVEKTAPVLVYCAGGVRSAFATKTLHELGYTNVVSVAGGFGKWKDEGRPWRTPAVLTAEQRNRYQRHILLPEVGVEGQSKLLSSSTLDSPARIRASIDLVKLSPTPMQRKPTGTKHLLSLAQPHAQLTVKRNPICRQ